MTIFIVWVTNFDGESEFHSAHSSEEKARERILMFSASDRDLFDIEPYTLDEDQ